MQVFVDGDEWYPVYSLFDKSTFGEAVELSGEEHFQITKVFKDFEDVQIKLGNLYKEAKRQKLLEASKEKAKYDGLSSNF